MAERASHRLGQFDAHAGRLMFETANDLWNHTEKNENGCWIWQGSRDKRQGYGFVRYRKKPYRAHRLSYTFANGNIPDGKIICHTCDTPACINPAHLYAGTHADNTRDALERGLHRPGVKQGNKKLTEDEVKEIFFDTRRVCELARAYKVSSAVIALIRHRKTWRYLTDKFVRDNDV